MKPPVCGVSAEGVYAGSLSVPSACQTHCHLAVPSVISAPQFSAWQALFSSSDLSADLTSSEVRVLATQQEANCVSSLGYSFLLLYFIDFKAPDGKTLMFMHLVVYLRVGNME